MGLRLDHSCFPGLAVSDGGAATLTVISISPESKPVSRPTMIVSGTLTS